MGAAMAGPGAAATCVRWVLEQLRGVSPGPGSRGPGGAEWLRRGNLELRRPVLDRCEPWGGRRGPGDPEGNVEVPEGPGSFPTSESDLPERLFILNGGSVTRGASDCRKLEFLADETSWLKRMPKLGPELRF